jgi:HEPN domain-containing protein
MNRDPSESAKAWLDKGDSDLRSARVLLHATPPELDVVCFHSQQAAEKYLKGFLAYHREDPPRTHDLTVLIDLGRQFDKSLSALYDAAEMLNPFAVHIRYPFVEDPPDEDEAVDAVQSAAYIRGHVSRQIDE